MKHNYIDLQEALKEICKQVKNGKMEIVNISCEPNIQPIYLTDSPEEVKRKEQLEYYEYNVTFRKYFKKGE